MVNLFKLRAVFLTGFLIILAVATGVAQDNTSAKLLFTIAEHDYYPENIAYDSKTDTFFLGSMSSPRIIRISRDGSYKEFINKPVKGLSSSVGMKVDAKRRALWVCTGSFALLKNYEQASKTTGILRFDVDTGKVTGSWFLEETPPTQYHIFNDIVLDDEGNAYATTTSYGRIYKVDLQSGKMHLLQQLQQGDFNNGIAIDTNNKHLFTSTARGISRFDLESQKAAIIPGTTDRKYLPIDGLYFYSNSLIAIRPRENQVLRLKLTPEMDKVTSIEVLCQSLPGWAFSTTGVIAGDKLVVVGTSYANVPRNPGEKQHGDIRIYQLDLSSLK